MSSSTTVSRALAYVDGGTCRLVWLNGRDLRDRPLVDRKAALRTLVRHGGRILYAGGN